MNDDDVVENDFRFSDVKKEKISTLIINICNFSIKIVENDSLADETKTFYMQIKLMNTIQLFSSC